MENENLEQIKKQDTPEAKALRILSKAKYLTAIAKDESLGTYITEDLKKAIYYLYRSAYKLKRNSNSMNGWFWLKLIEEELGLE